MLNQSINNISVLLLQDYLFTNLVNANKKGKVETIWMIWDWPGMSTTLVCFKPNRKQINKQNAM